MKISRNSVGRCVACLLECSDARQTVIYLSPTLRIKATRMRRRDNDFRVNIGKPNYAERKFVKLCIKSGEPLPVRNVQIKWFKKA